MITQYAEDSIVEEKIEVTFIKSDGSCLGESSRPDRRLAVLLAIKAAKEGVK